MTSFIGRRREKEKVRRLLQRSRMVTVIGSGGVGKTRLAEEVSLQTARAFQDSVSFIDLAPVRDPDSVPTAAAVALAICDHAVGGTTIDNVVEALRQRQMLLVIDNCEHLVEAVGNLVTAVLAAAPLVRILATSREPLGVASEFTYLLPPMSLPRGSYGNQEGSLAESEAVALFVERGQAVDPEFQISSANADSIAQLCIKLDGIPLAIELAAARLRSLSPLQLVHRLDHRFALLTGGAQALWARQQTLRAVVDWSFDLCSDAERGLWARLSVFPGSFDLDAAEAVCGYGDIPREHIIDLLDSLVAKSLVVVDRSTEQRRYSQLLTLREYGRELLDANGDGEEFRRRHRDHYLERAEHCVRSENWFSSRQSDLPTWWRVDHHNLIAALDWSSTHAGETTAAARLAVALRFHWISDGVLQDARIRLGELLVQLPTATRERGDVLWVTAWIALIQGDRESARDHLSECLNIADELSDTILQAHHDQMAALLALFCGDTTDAIELYERAIEVYRSTGELPETSNALFQLAIAQIYAGRPDATLESCADLVRLADAHHERWNKAYALWVSGIAYLHLGRTECAVEAAKDSLRIQLAFEDRICTALAIEVLAWAAEAVGDITRSARLFGAARFTWEELGTSVAALGPGIAGDSLQSQAQLRKSLGDKAYESMTSPPPDLTIGSAIHLALDDETAEATETKASPVPLTPREMEVATLVAKGLRNRQIAAQLVISPRTVDGHVERILNKLNMRSRAQLGAWVQQHS